MARDKEYFEGCGLLVERLRYEADLALERGPYSVIDKTTLPPSNDPKDYWHPAPYYWPFPLPIPGLPYIPRDGKRVPGTRLYEPMSERYDRTRLQRMFDETLILTLGGCFFSEERYLRHAAKLVNTWFLDQSTAMRPNLRYSQVRRGWNKNQGTSSGLIETKDFYFFLDAVKVLESLGALSIGQVREFKVWLGEFLNWLLASPQGVKERRAKNNHGTYYDLQVSSIASYLGDERLLKEIFHDARGRIVHQFSANGEQPEEMKRTTTAHYCCFNLQGWIHLALLAESCGEDLWGFEGPQGQSIRKAMEWLLSFIGREWPYQQINEFDRERFFPIYYAYRDRYGMPAGLEHVEMPEKEAIKPLFFPHDGIRPFWQLH